MKVRNIWLWSTLILIGFVFTGCRKSGCTDPDAVNYDSVAKKEDHSCEYEGDVIFWYGQNTSSGLIGDGASSLIFKIDEEIIGSTATNIYWTGIPDCSADGSISASKSLGNVKTRAANYSVEDQTGFEYWSGTINFTANTCESMELVW